MKVESLSENYFGELKNENNSIIDLTALIENTGEISSPDEYINPAKTWCSYMEREFRATRIMTGTKTGTHITAPANFTDGGLSINTLLPCDLKGKYFYIDADAGSLNRDMTREHRVEPFLFIRGCDPATELTEEFFKHLLDLPAKLWIAAGEFIIKGKPDLYFNQEIAREGKFLVEDINMNTARSVRGSGYAFVQPLKPMESSVSPCRLIVLINKQ